MDYFCQYLLRFVSPEWMVNEWQRRGSRERSGPPFKRWRHSRASQMTERSSFGGALSEQIFRGNALPSRPRSRPWAPGVDPVIPRSSREVNGAQVRETVKMRLYKQGESLPKIKQRRGRFVKNENESPLLLRPGWNEEKRVAARANGEWKFPVSRRRIFGKFAYVMFSKRSFKNRVLFRLESLNTDINVEVMYIFWGWSWKS